MNYITSIFPKVSFLLGIFLTVFIFLTKNNLGKNKCVRYSLGATTFIYSLLSLDTFTTANKFKLPIIIWYTSYILFPFIGFLFYKFSTCLTLKSIKGKKYLLMLISYSIIKSAFFFYAIGKVDRVEGFTNPIYLNFFGFEFILASSINIIFLYKSYVIFKETHLVIDLDRRKNIYFKWIDLLLKANMLLIIAVLVEVVLALFDYDLIPELFKIEPVLYTLFFFVLAYSLMYYPVFALTGDYEDLPSEEKYKHSNLSDSSELFNKIDTIVKTEKLYLSPKLKLNTIAKKLNCPVPYVSQAINENQKMSFTDYINTFRIEEAKKKLLVKNPDTIFAIAIDVGFNSKAAFYYAFKKLTNMTPTEFRKKNLESV
ncbi:helix-turn-helix domain-containing protein [Tenacibaculum sp. TC6]|uniref:helix-turn-helix domain-containing protein n=1 Tax=Tenacibaculum sp. TC6 TaxID=3423223 RepID=UPI003D36B603